MTAKAYLSQYRWLDIRIDAKLEQIERLRELAARRTAAYGSSGGGAGKPDRRADVVVRIVDAEKELDADIDRLQTLRADILHTISQLPDPRMRTLLELRYINGMKMSEIAERMNYSVRNVTNLHAAAIRKLCLVFPVLTVR